MTTKMRSPETAQLSLKVTTTVAFAHILGTWEHTRVLLDLHEVGFSPFLPTLW